MKLYAIVLCAFLSSAIASAHGIFTAVVAPGSGSCTINTQYPTGWITGTTANALGDCTIDFPNGLFGAYPICTFTPSDNSGTTVSLSTKVYSNSSTSLRFISVVQTSGSSTIAGSGAAQNIICLGE